MRKKTRGRAQSRARKIIRCLLAEDHAVVRAGLRSLLECEPGIEVVGDVGDGHTAVEMARALSPDVVLMDIAMPEVDGIEATRQICVGPKGPKILCLSAHHERGIVTDMLQAGASGYLLKAGAANELIEAVRVVAGGGTYVSPVILKDITATEQGATGGPALTTRERDVLQLIAEGLHTKEIAHRLEINIKTVFTHREHIMRKLGLHSNVALAKFALREGLSRL